MTCIILHSARTAAIGPAAIVGADHEPASLELVTLDQGLADAAKREGFTVRTV